MSTTSPAITNPQHSSKNAITTIPPGPAPHRLGCIPRPPSGPRPWASAATGARAAPAPTSHHLARRIALIVSDLLSSRPALRTQQKRTGGLTPRARPRGLRPQEETAVRHDALPRLDARENFDDVTRRATELHRPLNEAALLAGRRHVDDAPVADRLHSAAGHECHARTARLEAHVHEHPEPQVAAHIRHLDTDLRGTRRRIHARVDVRHPPAELSVGSRRHHDGGW